MADSEQQPIPQLVDIPFDGNAYAGHLEQLVQQLTIANAAKDSHILTLRQEVTRLNQALGEAREPEADSGKSKKRANGSSLQA